MKPGDLVKFCENFLPELKDKTGVLLQEHKWNGTKPLPSTPWEVFVDGKVWRCFIQEHFLTRVSK